MLLVIPLRDQYCTTSHDIMPRNIPREEREEALTSILSRAMIVSRLFFHLYGMAPPSSFFLQTTDFHDQPSIRALHAFGKRATVVTLTYENIAGLNEILCPSLTNIRATSLVMTRSATLTQSPPNQPTCSKIGASSPYPFHLIQVDEPPERLGQPCPGHCPQDDRRLRQQDG